MSFSLDSNPVLVEMWRGDLVESRHCGAIAVVDAAGRIVESWGDVERPVFARSAVKPLQALPLVESGAADRFGLGAEEIALACASHKGEPMHTETVSRWLARIDLGAKDLECGSHWPTNEPAAHALIRAGLKPSPLHSNCSGKHSGFLTTARHKGEATPGYIAFDHPVQGRVLRALEEMTGLELSSAPRAIDGCGIPVIGIPLAGMARAMARMTDTKGLPAERAAAARRILDAMAAAPLMVSGTGAFPSLAMAALPRTVRLKPGAEGVYCGALPTLGYGVALKIDDGASRASEVAMGAILERYGLVEEGARATLGPFLKPRVKNVAGREIGEIRPAPALAGRAGPAPFN